MDEPAHLKKISLPDLIKSILVIDERWQHLAVYLAIFLVVLIPRIVNLDTFMTADEDDQIIFAHHFLRATLTGDWSGLRVLAYPGVPTLILGAAGVGSRYLAHYAGWLPLTWVQAGLYTTLDQVAARFWLFEHPHDFLVWVRVPMALLASLSIVGIYFLAKRLTGERIALLATLIIAFDPFILAHSRVIHVDAPLSFFMFLSFLAFLLYLDRGLWRWLILSGLFGGLAVLSKTPAVLLGPILVISGALFAAFPPPEGPRSVRWKRLAVALLGWGVVVLAAVFALWPTMWSRPLFALQAIFRSNLYGVSIGAHPTTGIFWGDWQTDQSPLYYLLVFPYHLTPLTTAGVLAGLAMIGAGLVARWRKPTNWSSTVLPLALGLVVYAAIFVVPISAVARRGDRYILPLFLVSGLLSALALWWLTTLVRKRLPTLVTRFRLTSFYLVGMALLLQILFVLFYHPYYLAYFNPLMGGARTAPYRLPIGSGEGLELAAQYLNDLDREELPVVAAWYSRQFAPYYQGRTIDLSNQTAALTADYTVFYLNQVQRGFPSQEILDYFRQREPAHVVSVRGLDYAWIYEGPIISQEPYEDFTFPVEAVLGGAARLYGVDVPAVTMPADAYTVSHAALDSGPYWGYRETDEGLPVTLYWETLGSIQDNHGKTNVFIHLVDDQGNIWGTVDRLILAGLWRPIRWSPGFFLWDEYRLPLDPATPPGTYHLEVGMYDFETGKSYGVVKNIGQITLTPPEGRSTVNDLNLDDLVPIPINESLQLLGHRFVDLNLPPGAEIEGKIYWQASQSLDKDYDLEFSFPDQAGETYSITQQPLSPSYPLSQWRAAEIVAAAYRFRLPALVQAGEYPLTVTVVDPGTGQKLGESLTLALVTVEARERTFSLPDDVAPISAVLNDEIELVGYQLHDETVEPRGTFGLTLFWRSLKATDTNYTVFVHAVGPDQVIRGQWDSEPVQGRSPTGGWIPGEIIADHYEVPMSKKAPAWKYDVFVGMYDSLTSERVPIISPNAPVSENRVLLGQVQLLEE
jgi:4-amino-4-deoxy-L-arabinose transferase-like glycosyltransferase